MLQKVLSSYAQFSSQLTNIEKFFKEQFQNISKDFDNTFSMIEEAQETIVRKNNQNTACVMQKVYKVNRKLDKIKKSIKKEFKATSKETIKQF